MNDHSLNVFNQHIEYRNDLNNVCSTKAKQARASMNHGGLSPSQGENKGDER